RERVLRDDEIRLLWPLLAEAGTFGAIIKALLLTAQRRADVSAMKWSEIGEDGAWTIPAQRYKTKRPHTVLLSKAALAVIEAQPRGGSYVFPSTSGTPFTAYSKSKMALDAAIIAANAGQPLPNWTLHDLRRTAKTLMARAGVRPDISERVLGHVIGGVEGTY